MMKYGEIHERIRKAAYNSRFHRRDKYKAAYITGIRRKYIYYYRLFDEPEVKRTLWVNWHYFTKYKHVPIL